MNKVSESPEQIISDIITAFEKYALGDIRKVQENNMPIAAFILSVCFIDQLSCYIYSGKKNPTHRSKDFVAEYLNRVAKKPYDKDHLIDLLRNKLVHNYSLMDREQAKHYDYIYVLEYTHPKIHLERKDRMVFINIEGFINDLTEAFKIYKNLLINDQIVRANAVKHYHRNGIIVSLEAKLKLTRTFEITIPNDTKPQQNKP